MRRRAKGAWAAALFFAGIPPALGSGVQEIEQVRLLGPLHGSGDFSAVAGGSDLLLVASDEDARIQLLDPLPEGHGFRAREDPIQLSADGEEIDIEGLAKSGAWVYAIGSHSLVRKAFDADDPVQKNRERALAAVHEPARDRLLRLRLDAAGRVTGSIESASLRGILEKDPLLGPFSRIPGKENGVDIEGLAVAGDRLFIGLRSPVLRSGHVPVLLLTFDDPQSYELRLVDLGGRGIRDMQRVEGGFLLLAGGDGPATIFFWDGNDQVPGKDRPAAQAIPLGEVSAPEGARPEGLAVVRESPASYEAIVVHDGSPTATLIRISKP